MPVKKSDKAEKKASDPKKNSSSKKNNSKSKKSHSVNGKSRSDSKSTKSALMSIPEHNAVSTDEQKTKAAKHKPSSGKIVSQGTSVTDSLPGDQVPNGSSIRKQHITVATKTIFPVTNKSEPEHTTAKSDESANHAKKKSSKEVKTTNNNKADEEEEEEEEAACYLCHCGVDCSDRALFFPKDRKKEIQESDEDQEYYFGLDDPYLPQEMYDPHNALVYCDSCDRMYHQKCHFVPILKLPQGDWNCLICTIKATQKSCLPVPHDPKSFFASPPNTSSTQAERKFEFDSKTEKAKLWQKQLKSVKTFLSSQVSNIRLAKAALDTLTSTKRNRAMILSNRRKSQELAQTLLRMTTAKFKIRQTLQSLESLRVSPCTNSLDPTKVKDWCQTHPKHACHVVPHGINYFMNHRRVTPRTAEMKLDQERKKEKAVSKDTIPSEILCSPEKADENAGDGGDEEKKSSNSGSSQPEQTKASTSNPDDNDSGITLDDLQCCICMVGDSTDDNDVILCDGEGCYRAFHMKCIHPEIKPQDLENEDEDWFCPLCTATSTYTHGIYDALRDGGEDESEEEDEEKEVDEDEWDTPDDAFPNSKWEYETAMKFSQGKQNEDTNELLALYLGDEIVGTKKVTNPIGSDSEDENDYSLFDEESFAERKKNDQEEEEEEDEEDHSDRSSQATWLSSSIEMNIGKDELNALSEVEESDSDEGSSKSVSNTRRRSRRLRSTGDADQTQLQIGVDFDEGNIIKGKRQRKTVDYIKLNDALFGKMTEKQKATLDDGADYKTKKGRKRKSAGKNGNKKKRAKAKSVSDSSGGEKNGEDSTTTKQSESPSKLGTEEASETNNSCGKADRNDDSGSDGGSASHDDSGDENDSNSEDNSGSENDSDTENGSDSEDDEN